MPETPTDGSPFNADLEWAETHEGLDGYDVWVAVRTGGCCGMVAGFIGIFDTEDKAEAACTTPSDHYARFTINEADGGEEVVPTEWHNPVQGGNADE